MVFLLINKAMKWLKITRLKMVTTKESETSAPYFALTVVVIKGKKRNKGRNIKMLNRERTFKKLTNWLRLIFCVKYGCTASVGNSCMIKRMIISKAK